MFTLLSGCQSKVEKPASNIVESNEIQSEQEFEFYNVVEPFELVVTEFYPTNHSCSGFALPYALLIGETSESSLPKVVSVISVCDYRNFDIGQHVKIIPANEPAMLKGKNPLSLLYIAIPDTIIEGKQVSEWIIGSENNAVWGRPEQLE